ncbi:MAG: peroxiredoxin [Planctomycetota bacterium]
MRSLVYAGLLITALAPPLCGDSPEISLREGDEAPSFAAVDANGEIWKSEDHIGKKVVVVYFYPADLTSGCTAQACAYRDHLKELEEAEVEVVGVSGDSVRNHQIFTRVNSLNFRLLSDEQGKVAEAFGVPVREGATLTRMVDGVEQALTRGVTASRWTFIIGKDGRILRKCTIVEAEEDCKKVLETVRRLTADIE